MTTNVEEYIVSIKNNKKNQLNYIEKIIKLTSAFSIFYYKKASFWKKCYWVTNMLNIILTAMNTIINILFNQCSDDEYVIRYNVILGTLIMASMSGLTFLNAADRAKEFEEAGDKYNELANNIYIEVFCGDKAAIELDLYSLMERYRTQLDSYGDRFYEPNAMVINKIMESTEYKFLMNIKTRLTPEHEIV
jgi:hypothetical protein